MGRCSYVDDAHSFVDGYYCSYLDQHVDWCDTRDLCNSDSGSDRCPFCNGTPILTEEIAQKITEAFHSGISNAMDALKNLSYYVSDAANKTSMESLESAYLTIRDTTVHVPSARGIYRDKINLRSEEQIASGLESSLNEEMDRLRRVEQFPINLSGNVSVSAQDFENVLRWVSTYGDQARSALRSGASSLSGEEHFGAPAGRMMALCADEIDNYSQRAQSAVRQAEQTFVTGVAQAEAAARGARGTILDHAAISWPFED